MRNKYKAKLICWYWAMYTESLLHPFHGILNQIASQKLSVYLIATCNNVMIQRGGYSMYFRAALWYIASYTTASPLIPAVITLASIYLSA